MNTGKWMTVPLAQQALGKSERTIRRWAKYGKIQSRKGENGLEVLVDTTGIGTGTRQAVPQATPDIIQAELDRLKAELDRRDRQITSLEEDKRQLYEQLEKAQENLERQQQLHAYAVLPWWKKIGKRKELPLPGSVMDLGPEDK